MPTGAPRSVTTPRGLPRSTAQRSNSSRNCATQLETPATPIVISGNLGPRGDGYVADRTMSVAEAQAYHAPQIDTFAATAADLVSVFTMTYVEEAIGIARAAEAAGMPVAVSFTLETDGRLPSGMPLADAIEATDAATGAYPAYYMINCAHPTHFAHVLEDAGPWRDRLRGIRANASKRSHAELDEATDLDDGNPVELATEYRAAARRCCPGSPSSAAAAAPTTATSGRFARGWSRRLPDVLNGR